MVRRRRIRPASALETLPPLRILSQIAILQAAFYTVAAVLLLFTSLVQGSRFTFDLLFSWLPLQADNAAGWTFALVWLCNGLTNIVGITLLITRAKYVLDFALTIHFIHLLVTSFYTHSIPSSWLWWSVQLVSALITIMLATWLCEKRELQPISWGNRAAGSRNVRPDPTGGIGGSSSGGHGQQGEEMVPLKHDQDLP